MEIIKLNATNSTNTYLKNLIKEKPIADLSCVWALSQTQGRGQQGATWIAEPYKNLTFSVLKKFDAFPSEYHFLLNMEVSLAIFRALKKLYIPDLAVKWANDILSSKKKICGILIENTLSKEYITSSVIGIGVLLLIGHELEAALTNLSPTRFDTVLEEYHTHLFRKDKPSTFEYPNGERFMGYIRGVSHNGQLQVEQEDALVSWFSLKEVKLLY